MIRKILCIRSLLGLLLVVCFLIYPCIRAALDVRDPALQRPGIPKAAWRLYRNLTPRYAAWAKQRVAQGRAEQMSVRDVAGTEWPLFGSVFFLWAMQNAQDAWDAGDRSARIEPRYYAREAIIAASELVVDPKHASWVKKHWGDDYLHRENVFYRMLVIAALTSRERLLRDGAHLDLLRDQVDTLARELDASKTGLLNDYPGECYPGDVMAALMCIQRADTVLGTNHSAVIRRGLRAFTGARATRLQLPPYSANADTGLPTSEARGCGNSYFCLTAPELWPNQARQWFQLHDRFFWQKRLTAVGYREMLPGTPGSDWGFDVDAGPVIAGHGVSASAFGVGAARKNGRFDRAYPLAAEMLATTLELPNGVLAIPRLLSNLSDAPLLGEAAIFWFLTIQPEKGFAVQAGGGVPTYVYIVLGSLFLIGTWLLLTFLWMFVEARRRPVPDLYAPGLQAAAWGCALLAAVVSLVLGHGWIGLGLLLPALVLPIRRRKKPAEFEEWPEAQQAQAPTDKPQDGSSTTDGHG